MVIRSPGNYSAPKDLTTPASVEVFYTMLYSLEALSMQAAEAWLLIQLVASNYDIQFIWLTWLGRLISLFYTIGDISKINKLYSGS